MLELKKGETLDLGKEANKLVTKVRVGAGWDAGEGKTIDCDLWGILRGQAPVWYKALTGAGVTLDGDDRTGESSDGGADENMHIDAASLTTDEVVVVINIYDAVAKGQFFSDVKGAFVEIVDEETNTVLGKYDVSMEGGNNSALVAGKLTKAADGSLTFTAIGEFSTKGIEALITENGGQV